MDRKVIYAIVIVAILVVASAAVYVVYNRGGEDVGSPTEMEDAELKVYGNINGDRYLDESDSVLINQLIEDLLPKFCLRVEDKGGQVFGHLDAMQDEVVADEVHITNVISNLVDNAIKYCAKAPEISIYTRNKEKDIIISVIDNGIGIAKKDQKLIFERFYRVSTGNLHDVKGFGLGLSYVKKIVEAHGGRVEVESTPGKGSCFDIILPLSTKKEKIKRTLFF